MAATNFGGLGTQLLLTISSTPTVVAEMVELDGPDSSVATRDTTTLGTVGPRTYAPTIGDSGEVSGTCLYDPTDSVHQTVAALIATPGTTTQTWELKYPQIAGTTKDVFQGVLTKWKQTGMKVEENIQVEFSIQVSGAITRTP